jgi:SOS response regulatory protein OraA/RecX
MLVTKVPPRLTTIVRRSGRGGRGSALNLAVKAIKLPLMSIQEIKEQLAALPRNEQDEVIAYLFHLRHAHDQEYASQTGRRLKDKDPSHWLSPDAFERELDKKETP